MYTSAVPSGRPADGPYPISVQGSLQSSPSPQAHVAKEALGSFLGCLGQDTELLEDFKLNLSRRLLETLSVEELWLIARFFNLLHLCFPVPPPPPPPPPNPGPCLRSSSGHMVREQPPLGALLGVQSVDDVEELSATTPLAHAARGGVSTSTDNTAPVVTTEEVAAWKRGDMRGGFMSPILILHFIPATWDADQLRFALEETGFRAGADFDLIMADVGRDFALVRFCLQSLARALYKLLQRPAPGDGPWPAGITAAPAHTNVCATYRKVLTETRYKDSSSSPVAGVQHASNVAPLACGANTAMGGAADAQAQMRALINRGMPFGLPVPGVQPGVGPAQWQQQRE